MADSPENFGTSGEFREHVPSPTGLLVYLEDLGEVMVFQMRGQTNFIFLSGGGGKKVYRFLLCTSRIILNVF